MPRCIPVAILLLSCTSEAGAQMTFAPDGGPPIRSLDDPTGFRQGPMHAEHPPMFRSDLSFGAGQLEHRTIGSALDGDDEAGYFRLRGEGYMPTGFGGGLQIEAIGAEGDLFASVGIPDVDIGSGELFLYASIFTGGGDFAMPVRFGLVLHDYEIDDPSGDDVEYSSFGPRLEIEPEWTIYRDGGTRWGLYGSASVALLGTEVEATGVLVDVSTSSVLLGLEVGTRLHIGHVDVGVAFLQRYQHIDNEVEAGFEIFAVDTSFTGLLFSFGVTF